MHNRKFRNFKLGYFHNVADKHILIISTKWVLLHYLSIKEGNGLPYATCTYEHIRILARDRTLPNLVATVCRKFLESMHCCRVVNTRLAVYHKLLVIITRDTVFNLAQHTKKLKRTSFMRVRCLALPTGLFYRRIFLVVHSKQMSSIKRLLLSSFTYNDSKSM